MSKTVITEETAVVVRPLETIAIEIRSIDTQTREFVLRSAIEIGKRLTEAKSQVPHGGWAGWLEANVPYSQSHATNFMRVADEYSNSESLGNLSFANAIALLSLPPEDREAFVEENDVESMSSRELKAAIKEKQELERQLLENQERLQAEQKALETEKTRRETVYGHYQQELELRKKAEEDLLAAQEAAQLAVDQAAATGDKKTEAKLKVDLRKAEKAVADSKQRISDLESQMEAKMKEQETKLKTELEETLRVREQEIAERSKGIEEAALNKMNELQEENTKKLNEMQEQLRKNNNVIGIRVKVQFETLISSFNNLFESIGMLEDEVQKKVVQDRIAALCDQMKGSTV